MKKHTVLKGKLFSYSLAVWVISNLLFCFSMTSSIEASCSIQELQDPNWGKMYWLENDLIKISIISGPGGRIYDFVDKENGRQIFARKGEGFWLGLTDATYSGPYMDVFKWKTVSFDSRIVKSSNEEVAVEVSGVQELAGTTVKLSRIARLRREKKLLEIEVICENIGPVSIDSFGYRCHPEIKRGEGNPIIGIPQNGIIKTFAIPPSGHDYIAQLSEGWVASLYPGKNEGVAIQFPLDELRCIYLYYSPNLYNFEYYTKLAPLPHGEKKIYKFNFLPITDWNDISKLKVEQGKKIKMMDRRRKGRVPGSSLGIIPSPKKVIRGVGRINLLDGWKLIADKKFKKMGKRVIRELGLSSGKKKILKLIVGDTPEEGYLLNISKKGIDITASSERGFFYALKTLAALKQRHGNTLPVCEIEDYPSLEIRGFHRDLLWDRMSFEEIRDLIQTAGKYKLNTFLLEYADMFPYEGKHRQISSADSLSRREIKELVKTAKENYIEIIPQLQCLSYLRYILKLEDYKNLREENKICLQICPSNPDSLTLYKELASQIFELHPECKFLHVGGDESRQLGVCPKCREKVKRVGKAGLYCDYVNQVGSWIKEQGRIPIIWDDMLCANPESLDLLDKDTIIAYWDYWATGETSAFVVARSAQLSRAYDNRWDKEWKGELSDLESETLKRSNSAVNLKKAVGEEFLSTFGKYLGEEFPKRITSFPYLGYYQDKGYKVIGAPACTYVPEYGYRIPNPLAYIQITRNIKAFSDACIKNNARGVITTSWGYLRPEVSNYALLITSRSTWE